MTAGTSGLGRSSGGLAKQTPQKLPSRWGLRRVIGGARRWTHAGPLHHSTMQCSLPTLAKPPTYILTQNTPSAKTNSQRRSQRRVRGAWQGIYLPGAVCLCARRVGDRQALQPDDAQRRPQAPRGRSSSSSLSPGSPYCQMPACAFLALSSAASSAVMSSGSPCGRRPRERASLARPAASISSLTVFGAALLLDSSLRARASTTLRTGLEASGFLPPSGLSVATGVMSMGRPWLVSCAR
mmetsp:Transcript_9984/g.28670  ORF Transcript_9984/g.28670 Transcript_9984/m.28670 type:complete len:239 (-) Transcript_9984:2788-3504(-)